MSQYGLNIEHGILPAYLSAPGSFPVLKDLLLMEHPVEKRK